jgi:hypothetical protein
LIEARATLLARDNGFVGRPPWKPNRPRQEERGPLPVAGPRFEPR